MMPSALPNSELDQIDKDSLARSYLPLVRRIAASFARKTPHGTCVEDLVGAGMLGLADATNRYDPERAQQFRAFVETRIRGAIIDEIRSQGPLSRDMNIKSRKLTKSIRDLHHELNRQPNEDEISKRMELDLDKYHAMLVQLRKTTVLSQLVVERASGRPSGYPERVPDNPQDAYLFEELRALLAGAVSKLSDREQRVLAMYYKDELSLKEIGKLFEVTESRICQIRCEAVYRLRAMLEEEKDDG